MQVRSLNSQLAELQGDRSRAEERLGVLQKSMTEVEEDKRGLGKYIGARSICCHFVKRI